MPDTAPENKKSAGVEELDRSSLRWGLIFFLTLIVQISVAGYYVVSDHQVYYSLRLAYTLEYVNLLYPDEYNPTKMIRQAREAVLDELDRYSGYIEPAEMSMISEEFQGSYGGIGITIIQHDSGLMVTSVRDDGPAHRAGMLTGDIIIKADTTDMTEMTPHEATFVLRGPEDSEVAVEVLRNFEDTLSFNVTRKDLPLIHVPFAGLTEHNNLYIKLIDFEAGASSDISRTLDTLYDPNRDSIGGFILDLRGNPGGLLDEAINAVDLFMDKGRLIVGIKGRSRWVDEQIRARYDDLTDGAPLVILVDGFSASASEITAGSLKYAGRAVLVGDTTFGKGLVQEYKGFTDGSGMRLTRSRYYFEGENYINDPNAEDIDSGAGIPPDHYVKFASNDPFVRELEGTFLLREFATLHADEIVRFSPFIEKSPKWMDQFEDYAKANGFDYASNTTMLAALTRNMIAFEGYSERAYNMIDGIFKKSREYDAGMFEKYRDYIRRRIFQLALEYSEGEPEAYRKAILPYREDIVLAEKLIREMKR